MLCSSDICTSRAKPSTYVAQLARVEIVAALYRVGRMTNQQAALIDAAVAAFERHLLRSRPDRRVDRRPYQVVPMTGGLSELAATLCQKYRDILPHPLRALDAIQLASAIVGRQLVATSAPANSLVFVSADTRLLAIAASEGFSIENPLLHP